MKRTGSGAHPELGSRGKVVAVRELAMKKRESNANSYTVLATCEQQYPAPVFEHRLTHRFFGRGKRLNHACFIVTSFEFYTAK
jgi:hypothetical protein